MGEKMPVEIIQVKNIGDLPPGKIEEVRVLYEDPDSQELRQSLFPWARVINNVLWPVDKENGQPVNSSEWRELRVRIRWINYIVRK